VLAQSSGGGEHWRRNWQDLKVTLQDLVDGLAKGGQLLHFGGMGPQAIADAWKRPAIKGARLDCHQPVRYLAQHAGRREANKFLVLDPLHKSPHADAQTGCG